VNTRVKTGIVGAAVVALWCVSMAQARADPIPIVPSVPGGGLGGALGDALGAIGGGRGAGGGAGAAGAGIGGNETGPGGGGIFTRDFGISNPGAPAIFLCPGVGAAGAASRRCSRCGSAGGCGRGNRTTLNSLIRTSSRMAAGLSRGRFRVRP